MLNLPLFCSFLTGVDKPQLISEHFAFLTSIKKSDDSVDRSAVYKHPHSAVSEQLESSLAVDEDNYLYHKTMEIKEYGVVQIQLSTHMVRGLLSPEIQLLHLSPELSICLEHHRYIFYFNYFHKGAFCVGNSYDEQDPILGRDTRQCVKDAMLSYLHHAVTLLKSFIVIIYSTV